MKILTKPPKSGHLRIADNFDQTRRCALFRGLTVFWLWAINGCWRLLTIVVVNYFRQRTILDVWECSEYAFGRPGSVVLKQNCTVYSFQPSNDVVEFWILSWFHEEYLLKQNRDYISKLHWLRNFYFNIVYLADLQKIYLTIFCLGN